MIKQIFRALTSLVLLSILAGCPSGNSENVEQEKISNNQNTSSEKKVSSTPLKAPSTAQKKQDDPGTYLHTLNTDSGEYRIQVMPENGSHFPFNEYFSMRVRISQALKRINYPLKLTVDAGMRAHNHGMHSRPTVTQRQGGEFLVEGMLFHMPGEWQIQFDIERGVMRDSAELAIEIAAAPPEFSDQEQALIRSLSFNQPIPTKDPSNRYSGNTAAIAFGRQLFFSKKLSGDGRFSCASCHQPQHHWGDAKPLSKIREQALSRHTPTLWNVADARWLHWDGRADTLWLQATKPLESEQELASSRLQITHLIKTDMTLRQAYEQIFGALPTTLEHTALPQTGRPLPEKPQHPHHRNWQTLTLAQQESVNHLFVNIAKSIAAFEETIISKNSAFDRFVQTLDNTKGSHNPNDHRQTNAPALNTANYPHAAIRGLRLFVGKARCIHCHSGPNLSDSEFHSIFFDDDANRAQYGSDPGRYAAIKALLHDPLNSRSIFSDLPPQKKNKLDFLYRNIELKYKFKTPTLRNIAQTAPYMHDGQMHDLKTVIQYYNTISTQKSPGDHQEVLLQSLQLSEAEQSDLISFLTTLSDDRFLTTLSAHEQHTD